MWKPAKVSSRFTPYIHYRKTSAGVVCRTTPAVGQTTIAKIGRIGSGKKTEIS